ncbi:uncharacterized protein SPSK_04616 [Sporothrix schenckii 1099-18]|uniref:Uncharacterized protein n=1 Tax=Sporothrix schenckii 1099-18 TaxID=1397361 RepID=A0A0F2M4U7_SPOSC|nr:uncharacterized protein SPSK_04616 [Sporothrix schenckii 1099-18]KJR83830.1 hypothetical protein SPSK_04616 [Sporothrix schenckii 1099-18]
METKGQVKRAKFFLKRDAHPDGAMGRLERREAKKKEKTGEGVAAGWAVAATVRKTCPFPSSMRRGGLRCIVKAGASGWLASTVEGDGGEKEGGEARGKLRPASTGSRTTLRGQERRVERRHPESIFCGQASRKGSFTLLQHVLRAGEVLTSAVSLRLTHAATH